jgi:hypothetical protein
VISGLLGPKAVSQVNIIRAENEKSNVDGGTDLVKEFWLPVSFHGAAKTRRVLYKQPLDTVSVVCEEMVYTGKHLVDCKMCLFSILTDTH